MAKLIQQYWRVPALAVASMLAGQAVVMAAQSASAFALIVAISSFLGALLLFTWLPFKRLLPAPFQTRTVTILSVVGIPFVLTGVASGLYALTVPTPPSAAIQNFYDNTGGTGPNIFQPSGDITINPPALEPTLQLKDLGSAQLPHGTYKTKWLLSVETIYALPQIVVVARASSIQSLEVIAQRAGLSVTGLGAKRDGYAFKTLQSVAGDYLIEVITINAEQVVIEVQEDTSGL